MGTIVSRGPGAQSTSVAEILLATLTFQNTDGSVATPSESFVSFGMAFKKGDIPSSRVPQLKSGSTIIPAQFDLRNNWPDGSLRWCEVSCVVPSIAGAGTLSVTVHRAPGAYDNAQRKSLSAITATTDLKVAITNLTDFLGASYAGGSTTADFNTASAVGANTEVVKSGPICDQFRTWMLFPGQPGGGEQLAAWFYATVWKNGQISHIAKVHSGFLGTTGKTKLYYDASYKNGGSTIRQFDNDKTFTVASTVSNTFTCTAHGRANGDPVTVRNSGGALPAGTSLNFTADAGTEIITATAHGFINLQCVKFSSSGTLPGGLTAGVPYFIELRDANTFAVLDDNFSSVRDITSAGTGTHTVTAGLFPDVEYYVYVIDANTIQLSPSAFFAQSGQSASMIDVTDSGTGTHTLEFRVFQHAHSHWWTADTDGRLDWTANEATIFVKHDQTYLHSTGVLAPLNLSTTLDVPTLSTPTSYTPYALGDYRGSINGTGESDLIGWLPNWACMAYISGDSGYATKARVHALIQGIEPLFFINEATGRIPTMRGSSAFGDSGNYTGLGTNLKDECFFSNTNPNPEGAIKRFIGGTGGVDYTTGTDWSHQSESIFYPLVTEGGAHLLDAQIILANHALVHRRVPQETAWQSSSRVQKVVSGDSSFTYGLVCKPAQGEVQVRAVSWAMRSLINTTAIIPDDWDEKTYFEDVIATNGDYVVRHLTEFPSPGGQWCFNTTIQWDQRWMQDWMLGAVAHGYFLFEDANYRTWANHLKIQPIAYGDGTLGCVIQSGESFYLSNTPGVDTDSALADIGVAIGTADVTAVAATNVFTFGAPANGWTISNNDKIRFPVNAFFSDAPQSLPTGISADTWYFVINKSGSTFKVSITQGGAEINITTDGGTMTVAWQISVSCLSDWPEDFATTDFLKTLNAMRYAKACGITGFDTSITAHAAFEADIPTSGAFGYGVTPKYRMVDSF